jgi:hypothetical protein
MKKLYEIDELMSVCGYGHSENPEINNGYNCNHPNCEYKENGIGKCYAFGCPIAYEIVDEDDFSDYNKDGYYGDWEELRYVELHTPIRTTKE